MLIYAWLPPFSFAAFAPLRLCEKLPIKLRDGEASWFLAKAQRRKGRKGRIRCKAVIYFPL
jgi:hypothetical protein